MTGRDILRLAATVGNLYLDEAENFAWLAGVPAGAATRLVGELESSGYLFKVPASHPENVRWRLTQKGEDVVSR